MLKEYNQLLREHICTKMQLETLPPMLFRAKDLERLDKIDSIDLDEVLGKINTIATSEDTEEQYFIKVGRGQALIELKKLIDILKEEERWD